MDVLRYCRYRRYYLSSKAIAMELLSIKLVQSCVAGLNHAMRPRQLKVKGRYPTMNEKTNSNSPGSDSGLSTENKSVASGAVSDALFEQISALVDDELDASEQALLLRRLGSDSALQQSWSRYHLISDAIKGQCQNPGLNLSASVMARIDAEADSMANSMAASGTGFAAMSGDAAHAPASSASARGKGLSLRFLKPIAGFGAGLGIAATVATVSVLGVRGLQNDVLGNHSSAAEQIAAVSPFSGARSATGTRGTASAGGLWNDGFQQAAEHLVADGRVAEFDRDSNRRVIRRQQPIIIRVQPVYPDGSGASQRLWQDSSEEPGRVPGR